MGLPWLRKANGRQDVTVSTETPPGVAVSSAHARVHPLALSPDVWIAHAPPQLVESTRAGFRESVVELIERASEAHADEVTIDLERTTEIDASGLGLLVLAQRRARDHHITVRLAHVQPGVRRLMELTRLDFLFHIAQ